MLALVDEDELEEVLVAEYEVTEMLLVPPVVLYAFITVSIPFLTPTQPFVLSQEVACTKKSLA
ncbi:MAG: hypothetical protein A2Z99_06390 [Treponema sp. GWB1_62_6]|nr:MAG: hypothetical protein A2Z99_06390 [Treponema sp. GWB1_62_6]